MPGSFVALQTRGCAPRAAAAAAGWTLAGLGVSKKKIEYWQSSSLFATEGDGACRA
jgi:hypothetical protein